MNTKSRKPRKSNVKVTNYAMRYETLEAMVNDLVTLHPEMKNIFHLEDGENITPRYLHDEALAYFASNEPNVAEGTNLPVSISVNANGVTLKTAKFFTLRWNFKYDRDSGLVTDVTAYITTFIKDEKRVNTALANMMDILDREWELVLNTR